MRIRAVTLSAVAACMVGTLTGATLEQPQFPPWGIDLSYLDRTAPPGADFFHYGNGGWLEHAAIPEDRDVAGVNLEIDKGNEAKLKEIVAALLAKPDKSLSAEDRKLRDLYLAFEDSASIDKAGIAPIKADLDRIASLQSLEDIVRFMMNPSTATKGPFRVVFDPDDKNPDLYAVRWHQSGLGMPDRDYYLRDNHDIEQTRAAYKKYLTAILELAGITDASRALAVYNLETSLAQVQWPAEERRDADKTYNPMRLSDLEQLAPQYPWQAAFAAAGIPVKSARGERVVVVAEKSAFPKLAAVFAATPVSVWRDYLTVRYMHEHADYLSKPIYDTDFAFYGVVLGGQKQPLPRDIRGIHLLDSTMGEALGKLYCAKYFSPAAKAKIEDLVANLLKAYEADVRTLKWMTPATQAQALEKIDRIRVKVGYPDSWRDYSALSIRAGDVVGDVQKAKVFEYERELHRLDERVDRGEWDMTPITNNAYYEPTMNEIVFPAGILQPPYFDPDADDAVNYGEIGATIGHEISHGFDDQGSKYDASGRLHSWWAQEDRKDFEARTANLVVQFNNYEPLPGLQINGKLTLGENIADLAGLVIAHKAYQLSLHGTPAAVMSGFTGDQRFYIAYAQSWREIWSDGLTRRILLSNPHSPSRFRVNGVVRNDDGWYAAFPQIKPGDRYYLPPPERVRLW